MGDASLLLVLPGLLAAPAALPRTVDVRLFGIYHPKSAVATWDDAAGKSHEAKLSLGTGGLVVKVDGKTLALPEGRWTLEPAARLKIGPASTSPREYTGTITARAAGGEIVLVDRVPLEDYVASSVASESPDAPAEATKAMAVLVRTYAVKNRGRHADEGADLCDLTHCQLYKGLAPLATQKAAAAAALATSGQILSFGGEPAEIFFSASCGGHTADAAKVWGTPIPYLAGVEDGPPGAPICLGAQSRWTSRVAAAKLLAAFGGAGPPATDLEIGERDDSGRVLTMLLVAGGSRRSVNSESFRMTVGRTFGWASLKSTMFGLSRDGKDFVFEGKGFGHGVGLCQAGASARAAQGADYRAILEHYFPGCAITPPRDSAGPASSR
jgi:stage II sporulation protein D